MSIDSIIAAEPPSPSTTHSPPQSRKQKRLSKHLQHGDHNHNDDPAITAPPHPPSTTSPKPLSAQASIPRAPTRSTTMPPPAPSSSFFSSCCSRLLIVSIGNPAPYLSTLHSAGHTVLFALASALDAPLQRSASRAWRHGLLAHSERHPWTLWASPVSMNISGPAVAGAWKTFLSSTSSSSSAGRANGQLAGEPRLVVLHDELEAPLGAVRVRPGDVSPKGHNGLKSIRDAMPGARYTRIGIGIGRPESRSADVVAGYVLRKMSREERGRIEAAVGGVVEELRRLSGE